MKTDKNKMIIRKYFNALDCLPHKMTLAFRVTEESQRLRRSMWDSKSSCKDVENSPPGTGDQWEMSIPWTVQYSFSARQFLVSLLNF